MNRESEKGPKATFPNRQQRAYTRAFAPFLGNVEPPALGSAGAPLACFPLSIDSAEEAAHDIQREAMGRPSRSNVVA